MEKNNLQKNSKMSQVGKFLLKEKTLEHFWKILEDSEEYFKSVVSYLIQ